MNTPWIMDLESGPLSEPELKANMPEFRAPRHYKTAEAIEGDIARQQVEYFERAALSPVTGRVLAVGLMQGGETTILDGGKSGDERELLEGVWEHWSIIGENKFIGFNSFGFDWPFLIKRSWLLGVPVPFNVRDGRYWSHRIIDIMHLWQMGSYQPDSRISLGALATYLKVGHKGTSGAEFHRLWVSDRSAAIAYLRNDLVLTASCARKMGVV